MTTPEHYQSDVLFFFEGRELELALYEALFEKMQAQFPTAAVRVQKSQISFCGRHLFAMVSLPRRRQDCGLVLSFGLSRRVLSPRIALAVEPYPNRWTHHVPLSGEEELDAELLDWLREAWEFSQTKGRKNAPSD